MFSVPFNLRIDRTLLILLVMMAGASLVVLYSASNQDLAVVIKQATRFSAAFIMMLAIAQVSPHTYKRWAPVMYVGGLILLILVLILGTTGKGAQRWINIGGFQFQPSEIMKLALPLMVAWWLSLNENALRFKHWSVAFVLVAVATLLIAKQPDLGTSILIAASGLFVLYFAGLSWKVIGAGIATVAASLPALWMVMHDYQKQRVLTFLNPESDPLGSGYHIIQSKIAIGSGGIEGKGWLAGTQSQLNFLPEQPTDFIFSVISEEFGLFGVIALLSLYFAILLRGLWITLNTQMFFARCVAGSITLTFFTYIFVNIGMVSGLLPVVGVPLPLISYGGTSMLTLMAGFGILMGIYNHQQRQDRQNPV